MRRTSGTGLVTVRKAEVWRTEGLELFDRWRKVVLGPSLGLPLSPSSHWLVFLLERIMYRCEWDAPQDPGW